MIIRLKHISTVVLLLCSLLAFSCSLLWAQDFEEDLLGDSFGDDEKQISDPLEPVNRLFFVFNDKLYYWVLKPVSQTYAAILADDVRMCIGNAFNNLFAPIRIVNNLLQGKVADSGTELARFLINTIVGAGGLADPATDTFHLNPKKEDLGQTLGKWGVGEGVFICWPIFGPSNVRDTVGLLGDSLFSPLTYLASANDYTYGVIQVGQKVNLISLSPNDYEQFKESTFDPYTAMRDFYTQSRRSKIEDRIINDISFSKKGDKVIADNQAKEVAVSAQYVDLNNIDEYGDLKWSIKYF